VQTCTCDLERTGGPTEAKIEILPATRCYDAIPL
jgi:hypothetical protein